MELRRIEQLIEKYFDAATTVAEERELKEYFSKPGVAPHLEQYTTMFAYFAHEAAAGSFNRPLVLKRKVNTKRWLSIAASVVLMAGAFTLYNKQPANQQELGTYNDPEKAFAETQKALDMLSENVNKGVVSINYLGEYQKTKEKVFKE